MQRGPSGREGGAKCAGGEEVGGGEMMQQRPRFHHFEALQLQQPPARCKRLHASCAAGAAPLMRLKSKTTHKKE